MTDNRRLSLSFNQVALIGVAAGAGFLGLEELKSNPALASGAVGALVDSGRYVCLGLMGAGVAALVEGLGRRLLGRAP